MQLKVREPHGLDSPLFSLTIATVNHFLLIRNCKFKVYFCGLLEYSVNLNKFFVIESSAP